MLRIAANRKPNLAGCCDSSHNTFAASVDARTPQCFYANGDRRMQGAGESHRPHGQPPFQLELARAENEFFRRLTVRYAQLIRVQLLHGGIREDELAELEQDVWVLVWSARRQFRGAKREDAADSDVERAFAAWLRKLCRTAAARRRRAEARHGRCHSLQQMGAESDSRRDAESLVMTPDADARLDVAALTHALPPQRRRVLLSRVVHGLTTKETAQLIGCAEGTVKATLHAALSSLREQRAPFAHHDRRSCSSKSHP